jgi:NAD(P)-dependent dehydrogenase (short-subunit alcohol dehydrogenase family)
MEVNGQSAIVTGGASGLGWACVERLARIGARVAIFDVDTDRGLARAKEAGGHFVRTDVTDENDIARSLAEAEQQHGIARILVNCAGIGPPAKVIGRDGRALPLKDFSRIISINLLGTFNVMAKFAERLQAAVILGEERGVIVNTSSVAAFDGQIGQAAYAASKGAIVAMTLPIAREFARYAIRVMTIAPGIFLTPLLESLPQEARDSLARQVPFPSRLGAPSEFAHLVESIICNPMLNGETIRLDGAIRMGPK